MLSCMVQASLLLIACPHRSHLPPSMNVNLVERIRRLHAEIEQARNAIVGQMCVEAKNDRHEILKEHFILRRAMAMKAKAAQLLEIYASDEYAAITSNAAINPDAPTLTAAANGHAVADFDAAHNKVRAYHQRCQQPPYTQPRDALSYTDEANYAAFSPEERHGRCIDLQAHYAAFVSFMQKSALFDSAAPSAPVAATDSPFGITPSMPSKPAAAPVAVKVLENTVTFNEFVKELSALLRDGIHTRRKMFQRQEYLAFIEGLQGYLWDFVERTKPLKVPTLRSSLQAAVTAFQAQFDQYQKQSLPGGAAKGLPGKALPAAKVGGIHGVEKMWWAPLNASALPPGAYEDARRCAAAEYAIIWTLTTTLGPAVDATVVYLYRKVTKTSEELMAEVEDDDATFRQQFTEAVEAAAAGGGTDLAIVEGLRKMSDSARDVGVTHEDLARLKQQEEEKKKASQTHDPTELNLKNLPLDPATGKPIAMWLYYLHGLNKTYYCEICAFTYQGEKAYASHFQELRHTKGLERLGIEVNSPMYYLVPKREDVLKLYADQVAAQKSASLPAVTRKRARAEDEEMEDVNGTVLTREHVAQFRAQPGPPRY